jgi:hypothetical protein
MDDILPCHYVDDADMPHHRQWWCRWCPYATSLPIMIAWHLHDVNLMATTNEEGGCEDGGKDRGIMEVMKMGQGDTTGVGVGLGGFWWHRQESRIASRCESHMPPWSGLFIPPLFRGLPLRSIDDNKRQHVVSHHPVFTLFNPPMMVIRVVLIHTWIFAINTIIYDLTIRIMVNKDH